MVIGSIAGVAAIAGALWLLFRRRKQPQLVEAPADNVVPEKHMYSPAQFHSPGSGPSPGSVGTAAYGTPVDPYSTQGQGVQELDGQSSQIHEIGRP